MAARADRMMRNLHSFAASDPERHLRRFSH